MFTDKIDGHSYDLFYRLLVNRWLMHPHPRILEIGVQFGLSMDYWHGLMPDADLTGIDIEDLRHNTDLPQQMIVTNAYHEAALLLLTHRTYDLIVDDGPHTLPSMEFAAKHYAPRTAIGGAFVIEDIPDRDWATSLIPLLPEDMQASSFVVDLRSTPGTTGDDDILLVALRDA
jgi:hypothetical protein